MRDSPALTQIVEHMTFKLTEKHLKKYPYFDQLISSNQLLALLENPDCVAKNAFFPSLQYAKSYQPFRTKTDRPERKVRLIRYASRKDSAIFAYYRHILSRQYEDQLTDLKITHVPTAYRKIQFESGVSGG